MITPSALVARVTNESGEEEPEGLKAILIDTLVEEGVVRGTVDLFLVDVAEMTSLNGQHMEAEGPTDVLSFPLDGPDDFLVDGPPPHVGDIVLCLDVARRQAPEHCGEFRGELTLLLIHGVLHLLGHDHYDRDEAELMRSREIANLERYGIRHPSAVARSRSADSDHP